VSCATQGLQAQWAGVWWGVKKKILNWHTEKCAGVGGCWEVEQVVPVHTHFGFSVSQKLIFFLAVTLSVLI